MSEHYGEIEYRDGKVSQPWRGSGGYCNFLVTFACDEPISSADEFLVILRCANGKYESNNGYTL